MARPEEQARRNPDAPFPGISSCHNPESFHGRGELILRQERSLEGSSFGWRRCRMLELVMRVVSQHQAERPWC